MTRAIATHVSLENASLTMREAGSFAWALGRLLRDVAEHDSASAVLTEAVIAGLAMGLQIVGGNLQDDAEQYRQLIENAEAAPQNADMPNRGATSEVPS